MMPYPFTAVVGMDEMALALTLSAVSPAPVGGAPVDDGFVTGPGNSLHASYLHVHWAGHPALAKRFAAAAAKHAAGSAEPAAAAADHVAGSATAGRTPSEVIR